jgi:3-hydroxyacyl-CoA dehydrogenase
MTDLPKKVAVIGAGDIGCGWAALCASAGWPVAVFDASARGLERAAADVPQRARALVALERATQGVVERGLLEFTSARSLLQAVQDADWVIEATPEDLLLKQKVFDSIEHAAAPDALLTSS